MRLAHALFLLAIPAALAAQGVPGDSVPPYRDNEPATGLAMGVTGFTGGTWQPSGLEVGYLHAVGRGSSRAVYGLLRFGSFVQDQAVLIGSTQGFFASLEVGGEMPLATIAEMGTEGQPPSSFIRVLGMLEGGVELNANSPLPQGSAMGVVSPLIGFSFGSAGGTRVEQNFALLLGPSWFIGKTTDTHLQVTLRYQFPLGARDRRRHGR